MKIGPFQIVRASDRTPSAKSALGASGTINFKGFLQPDEYNSDLRGKQGLDIYRRMLRSDASVREAYLHATVPIINASWDVEPAGDEPEDLEIAEMVRRAFFEWPIEPWQQTVRTILKYLAQGFQVFELVDQVVEAELSYDDPQTGQPVTAGKRQFLAWRMLAHRRPETIYKWNVHGGELQSVQQLVWKDDTFVQPVIPADRLVVFVHEREGDDFTGVSLLRSAYKAWWEKEVVEKVAAVAIERHGVGVNVGYVPKEFANDSSMLDRVEQMIRDVHVGGKPYLVFPGPKGTTGGATGEGGFFFEIVTPASGLPDFTPFLEYLRGEIKGNVLARFAELGHGQTGARATATSQSEAWYAALHACANYICDVFREPIRRLVLANYQTDRFPKLVARDIESRSLAEFADANAKLTAAGAIVADQSYRAYVRKGIDAPDEDEPDPNKPDPYNPLPTDPNAQPTEPLDPKPTPSQTDEAAKRRDQQQRQTAAAVEHLRTEVTAAMIELRTALEQRAPSDDVSKLVKALDGQRKLLSDAIAALAARSAEPVQLTLDMHTPRTRRRIEYGAGGQVLGSVEEPIDEEV